MTPTRRRQYTSPKSTVTTSTRQTSTDTMSTRQSPSTAETNLVQPHDQHDTDKDESASSRRGTPSPVDIASKEQTTTTLPCLMEKFVVQHYAHYTNYTEDLFTSRLDRTKGSSTEPRAEEELPRPMLTDITSTRQSMTAAPLLKEAFVVKHFEQHTKYTEGRFKSRVGIPAVSGTETKHEDELPNGGLHSTSHTKTQRTTVSGAHAFEQQLIAKLRGMPNDETKRVKLAEVVMMLKQKAHELVGHGLSLAGNVLLCKRLLEAFGDKNAE